MENFRKLAKIAALNQKMPGPVCGNPDCEDLCAEAYDAALSLRLDPAETIRKIIERELHCLPAGTVDVRACRFGFIPASDSLVLSAKKKKEDNEVVHIFRTGVNECKKCQALEGTKISSDVWADEEKMKAKGFWKQKNGEYLPHPNCKCHWEEKTIAEKGKTDEKKETLIASFNEQTRSRKLAEQLANEIIQVLKENHHAQHQSINLNNVFLVFDGERLISSDGKLLLSAVAGKPVKVEETITTSAIPGSYEKTTRIKHFDYSKDHQRVIDFGPLPEGTYAMRCEETGSAMKGSFRQHINMAGRYSWGDYNWRLTPTTDTNMFGRDRFSFTIHGGIAPESSGCIDLTSGDRVLRAYLQTLKQQIIYVVVKYPEENVTLIIEDSDFHPPYQNPGLTFGE